MIEATGNDLVVIASNPAELAEGQRATIDKVIEKQKGAEIELRQARVALESAANHGMDTRIANRLAKKAEKRLEFVGKVRSALEAGYVIVPNFPAETVAIRVKRSSVRQGSKESYQWAAGRTEPEPADVLPEGRGRYVAARPLSRVEKLPDKPNETGRYLTIPTEFDDVVELPVEFVRPTVVERTGKCMARKIFDEIAVSGNWLNSASGSAKGDPMVIGRLFDRSRSNRMLSFLVAWFVDTRAI